MIKHLIDEYRQTAEGGPRDYPTPSEYIRWEQLFLDERQIMKRKHISCILYLNVRFILDSLKKEYYKGTKYPATFDHWRPQHKLCPFCLINFRWEEMETNLYSLPLYLIIFLCRIYSRLEENDEDALYFFTKAGLGSDFELVRENVQGERGKAANVDMTHERST